MRRNVYMRQPMPYPPNQRFIFGAPILGGVLGGMLGGLLVNPRPPVPGYMGPNFVGPNFVAPPMPYPMPGPYPMPMPVQQPIYYPQPMMPTPYSEIPSMEMPY